MIEITTSNSIKVKALFLRIIHTPEILDKQYLRDTDDPIWKP